MRKNQPDNIYLYPNRLSDVIRLIVVLAVDKHSFRTESGLNSILRDLPKSSDGWLLLAKDHPEFFRFNKDASSIVLLIRFIQKVDIAEGELRDPLSVDQTQRLIDQAIALHDRQLARSQKHAYKIPIRAAIIAALSTLIVAIFTWYTTLSKEKTITDSINKLDHKIDSNFISLQKLK
jgi:hypothetical protein